MTLTNLQKEVLRAFAHRLMHTLGSRIGTLAAFRMLTVDQPHDDKELVRACHETLVSMHREGARFNVGMLRALGIPINHGIADGIEVLEVLPAMTIELNNKERLAGLVVLDVGCRPQQQPEDLN